MRARLRQAVFTLAATALLSSGTTAWAATNRATDPGGSTSGITLTTSGDVTVTSSALKLVKQVYDASGNCLASSPTDGSCNAGAMTVSVPAGTALKFLIFVKNDTDVTLSDVRFEDVLDVTATGFTYGAGTIKYTNTPTDAATAAQIYTAANTGTAQLDTLGAPDDFAAYNSGLANTLTVGAVVGQANQTVNLPTKKTFAVLFSVTKK